MSAELFDAQRAEFERLEPRGPVWIPRPDAVWSKLLLGLALPFVVLEQVLGRFVQEADPRTTTDLLPDFERVYGLPDACTTTSTSLIARRAEVLRKMRAPVGQSEPAIASVVHALGLPCTVESHRLAVIDELEIGDYLYDEAWAHSLTIHLPDPPVVFFQADFSGAGDPLAEWVGELLECAVERVAPAHAALVFAYDIPQTDYQPWDPWEPTLEPADARAAVPAPAIEEG